MGMCIAFVLKNFAFVMTVLALALGFLTSWKCKNRSSSDYYLGFLFFFGMGFSGLWGFVYHVFFPQMAAEFIGWQNSPFQFEVGVANLGFGLVGLFGLMATRSYRIAGTIFTASLLWGAAVGHVVQMINANNVAPGNAGLIFYNDILLPVLLIFFLLRNTRTDH